MKITDRNSYQIVHCEEGDIRAFNAAELCSLPDDREILFGFEKFSGDLKRVIPQAIRQGGTAWERLRDRALAHMRREQR